jgi:hypothetical protein
VVFLSSVVHLRVEVYAGRVATVAEAFHLIKRFLRAIDRNRKAEHSIFQTAT